MADGEQLGHQRIVPYLTYADAPAAIEWLCRVFGFEEIRRMETGDGRIGHAALTFLGEQVMISSAFDEAGTRSPRDLPALHQQITVYVDDVDAHFAHARAEGAAILSELEDQFWGDRTYWVQDLEGHRWSFQQHMRVVPDEESAEAMRKIASEHE
ncbi:MAG: VOC family protein [Chloroflexota bacterium]|nr:VOC family protein [Chloroflexota bacterium]